MFNKRWPAHERLAGACNEEKVTQMVENFMGNLLAGALLGKYIAACRDIKLSQHRRGDKEEERD